MRKPTPFASSTVISQGTHFVAVSISDEKPAPLRRRMPRTTPEAVSHLNSRGIHFVSWKRYVQEHLRRSIPFYEQQRKSLESAMNHLSYPASQRAWHLHHCVPRSHKRRYKRYTESSRGASPRPSTCTRVLHVSHSP